MHIYNHIYSIPILTGIRVNENSGLLTKRRLLWVLGCQRSAMLYYGKSTENYYAVLAFNATKGINRIIFKRQYIIIFMQNIMKICSS